MPLACPEGALEKTPAALCRLVNGHLVPDLAPAVATGFQPVRSNLATANTLKFTPSDLVHLVNEIGGALPPKAALSRAETGKKVPS